MSTTDVKLNQAESSKNVEGDNKETDNMKEPMYANDAVGISNRY